MADILVSITFKLCKEALEQIIGIRSVLLNSLDMSSEGLSSELEIKACDFLLPDSMVNSFKKELKERFRYDSSQYVYFDNYALFESNGMLAFIPTNQSKAYLLEKIRKINSILNDFNADMNSYEPLLFLERQFSANQFSKIRSLTELKVVDFEFFCESIFLRLNQLNTFDSYDNFEIKFGNERLPNFADGQLRLF